MIVLENLRGKRSNSPVRSAETRQHYSEDSSYNSREGHRYAPRSLRERPRTYLEAEPALIRNSRRLVPDASLLACNAVYVSAQCEAKRFGTRRYDKTENTLGPSRPFRRLRGLHSACTGSNRHFTPHLKGFDSQSGRVGNSPSNGRPRDCQPREGQGGSPVLLGPAAARSLHIGRL